MINPTSAWLDALPSLGAGLLRWRNALHRWPLAAGLLALCLLALLAIGCIGVVGRAIASAAGAPLIVLALTALLLAAIILRCRRRLAHDRHRDWLAALPHDAPLTLRAASVPLAPWLGTALVVGGAALVARVPLPACAALVLASAGGYLVAIAFVALTAASGRRRRRSRDTSAQRSAPKSRYAVVRRVRPAWSTDARLVPLGYWPVAQTRFSDRPAVRARTLVLLLLGAPLGTPAAVVLAVAAASLIVLHLLHLLLGLIRSAFAASWWLAPTPVRALRFTVALSHRALIGQIAGCALLVGAAYAVAGIAAASMASAAAGVSSAAAAPLTHAALARAACWLGAVCVLSAAACLIALRTRSIGRSALHRWLS